MKKTIIILSILTIFMVITKQDYIEIPKDSIRLRVIPNSNNIEDILIKEKVINNIYNLLKESPSLEKTKENISESLEEIKLIINKTLKENNIDYKYDIKFGSNYFPKKIYKDTIYKEGYYESLVIYLGEAKGDNFWCVLYPPLCMLENTETKDVEYKFRIKEILDSI